MKMETDDGIFGADRTVKQCPPFIDAMVHGFVICLPCDITVSAGRFSWDWPHSESPLAFHLASQVAGTPLDIENVSVLKFINFWAIETDPGVSVLFVHPVNRPDLPFRTLSGMVDTDGFRELPVHFPAQWVDPAFEGVLEKGTPVAQGIPVYRERLELDFGAFPSGEVGKLPALKREIAATPGYYRTRFRGGRDDADG